VPALPVWPSSRSGRDSKANAKVASGRRQGASEARHEPPAGWRGNERQVPYRLFAGQESAADETVASTSVRAEVAGTTVSSLGIERRLE
jgi:hypothetical protein